jgi:hypothetical protein
MLCSELCCDTRRCSCPTRRVVTPGWQTGYTDHIPYWGWHSRRVSHMLHTGCHRLVFRLQNNRVKSGIQPYRRVKLEQGGLYGTREVEQRARVIHGVAQQHRDPAPHRRVVGGRQRRLVVIGVPHFIFIFLDLVLFCIHSKVALPRPTRAALLRWHACASFSLTLTPGACYPLARRCRWCTYRGVCASVQGRATS